jgi:uncharacterized protein (DUF983 family)
MPEDIEREIQIWKRGDEIKTQQTTENIINNLWGQIGSVTAKCPYCGGKMEVRTVKSKKCIHCGKSYQMYPANTPSRIVKVPAGKIKILHNIHSLETSGCFENIL